MTDDPVALDCAARTRHRSRPGRTRRPAVRRGRGAAAPVGRRPAPLVARSRTSSRPCASWSGACSSRPGSRCSIAAMLGQRRRDGARAPHPPAGAGGRTGSPRGSSTSRWSTTATTSSASSPRAFDRMRVQLAQLDTARKEFVANASHELRTPLFSLAGFLELMDDEDLDEETRGGFLATTREQVDRLTQLAADLLDLSRMDAGRLRVEQRGGRRSPRWRECSPRSSRPSPRRPGTSSRSRPTRVWAIADEERVLQVGRALRGNALAHTPPGTRGRHPDARARAARRCSGQRRRAGDRARALGAHLRPLLSGRGAAGVGERARSRDRPRARGADGRHGRLSETRPDDVRARAPGGRSRRLRRRLSRLSRPARFHVKTAGGARRGRWLQWPMRRAVAVVAARRRGARRGRRARAGTAGRGRRPRPSAGRPAGASERPDPQRAAAGASTRRRSTRPRGRRGDAVRRSRGRRRVQGSGFVVDRAARSSRTRTSSRTSPRRRAVRGASAVYVEFRDGERVPATIVGWDLFNDVGVVRVDPADHAAAGAARRLVDRSSSASRWPRSAARSASRPRSRSASSRPPAARSTRSPPGYSRRRRDPDRRADQPRQLRRPALRRARARDRHQRADPRDVRQRRRRRLRDPDQHRAARARPARADGQGRYAYIGITTQDVTPGMARSSVSTPRGALVARWSRARRPRARACRRHADEVVQRPRGHVRRRRDRRIAGMRVAGARRRVADGDRRAPGETGHVHRSPRRHEAHHRRRDPRRAAGRNAVTGCPGRLSSSRTAGR